MDRLDEHIAAIEQRTRLNQCDEATAAPIFTAPVFRRVRTISTQHSVRPFEQYGLLGAASGLLERFLSTQRNTDSDMHQDPRLFVNLSHPLSVFICGSQGSGKSHTLSCLLENCLLPSGLNKLSSPLTALVFHYDTFISDFGGSPCEAAYLSSSPEVSVKVLCSPTNIATIRVSHCSL